jgi:membrane-bound metal-dependent hydrolase YbcI (DUF457 family)
MPSPVGHALGGLIVGLALPRARGGTERPTSEVRGPLRAVSAPLLLCAAAAVLPDLDFLWSRHNSLGAAVLVGLATLAWTRGRAPGLAVAVALAWASHVLFDWLGSDTTPPLGVMALWPFSSDFYFADAFVFDAISRRTELPGFWSHNLWAVVREVAMLGPLVALAAWRSRRERRRAGRP